MFRYRSIASRLWFDVLQDVSDTTPLGLASVVPAPLHYQHNCAEISGRFVVQKRRNHRDKPKVASGGQSTEVAKFSIPRPEQNRVAELFVENVIHAFEMNKPPSSINHAD